MPDKSLNESSPGRESLVYESSKVSWATAEFIRQPPALAARVFVYAVAALLVGTVTYSYFAVLAVFIETRGSLVTAQASYPLRVTVPFKVKKIFVKVNQPVKKGELLLESEDQIDEPAFHKIVEQVRLLTDLLNEPLECRECASRLQQFSSSAFQIDTHGDVKEPIAQVRELLRDYLLSRTQYLSLGASLASLRRQVDISRGKIHDVKKQKAERLLAMQVEQLRNDVSSAQAQISDRTQAARSQVEQSRNRLESRLSTVVSTVERYREQNSLMSPIDGTVAEIKLSGVGQRLDAGQQVFEVIPAGTDLVAEVLVPNRDISQIKVGLATKIKLDALPEHEYGTVDGEVSVVPMNVEASGSAQGNYKVIITLHQQRLTKGQAVYQFRSGMTLSALVITQRESMLKLAIRKILNIKDDVFKG